jgi:hypothetical protein
MRYFKVFEPVIARAISTHPKPWKSIPLAIIRDLQHPFRPNPAPVQSRCATLCHAAPAILNTFLYNSDKRCFGDIFVAVQRPITSHLAFD